MKQLYLFIIGLFLTATAFGQDPVYGPGGYAIFNIGNNGQTDYTKSLILLHEIYNGTPLTFNNVSGTITAYRGAINGYNRIAIATVNTTSAYTNVFGTVQSMTSDVVWKLKTCMYSGKKYIALDIPYADAHQNLGFQFAGWANSSGEKLKLVNYSINGAAVNQDLLTNIVDYASTVKEDHAVSQLTVTGNVGIGTTSPDQKLTVNGTVHATKVNVETSVPPDYVFEKDYPLRTLDAVKTYVDKNHHLPDVPSAAVMKKNGLDVGEMNEILLQKVEELTLYLIEKDKAEKQQKEQLRIMDQHIKLLETKLDQLLRTSH